MASFNYLGHNAEAVFITENRKPGAKGILNSNSAILAQTMQCWGNLRVIFREADGTWCEMIHDNGTFKSMCALSDSDRRRWREWLLAEGEEFERFSIGRLPKRKGGQDGVRLCRL